MFKAFSLVLLIIVGIHSFPQEDWNNVKGRLPLEYRKMDGPMYDGNYCRHGSIVFPTWHRAYVYQFEVYPTLFAYTAGAARW